MCSTGVATPSAVGAALPCPLCCQTNFPSVDSLRVSLVSVSSRLLPCPICHEMLMGLDKLTIHLFSHTLLNGGSGVGAETPAEHHHHHHQQRPVTHHQPQPSPAPSATPVQNGDHCARRPQPQQRRTEARCQVCGCTFRNHELHQMHMQLIHDITIADPIDDASDDGESVCMMSVSGDGGGAPQHNDDAVNYALLPSYQQHQQHMGGGGGGGQQHQQQSLIKTAATTTPRFQCHLCPKSFKLKGSLRVHLRVVHLADGGTPFHHQVAAGGDASTSQSAAVVCTIPIVYDGDGATAATPSTTATTTPTTMDAHHQHLARSIVVSMGGGGSGGGGGATPSGIGWPSAEAGCAMDRNGSNGGEATKLWECDICAKWFTTKYFLKKHKRLHTGEMPYTCEHCSKTFTFQQSYHKHLLYHTDDKPHVCLTCGRAFKEMSTLHNHERIHSGEKPFKCETCDKCFRQRVSYLVHRRIHTGVMPYKCTACDKSFRYKVSQRTHKCLAQPPGEVVRQTGDLLQRLIQSSMLNDLDSTGAASAAVQSPSRADGDRIPDVSVDGHMQADSEDSGSGHHHHHNQPAFATNQALDAFVVEHCNRIGIADEQSAHDGQEHPPDDATLNDAAQQHQAVPSPSSQFQDMCLYSPTGGDGGGSVGGGQAALADAVETYQSALDAMDEVALSNFMNEIN